jgi:hypothetical protein
VAELAPCEDHRVEQFLDLRITCLRLRQNLADVVYPPLDRQGVPLLRALSTMIELTTWVVAAT